LFERDDATNAFVPVITLAGALKAGDKVTVRRNRLYKIDELTNAMIPVVSGGGGGLAVPDYANKSSVKASGTTSVTWTADATGFACINTGVNSGSASVTILFTITINGKVVDRISFWQHGNALNVERFYPIASDDTILVTVSALIDPVIEISFIPPKFAAVSAPVVQEGGDYSLAEQPVLVRDGGVVRQKMTTDNKPLWVRTLNLNNPASVNGVWATGVNVGNLEIRRTELTCTKSAETGDNRRLSLPELMWWTMPTGELRCWTWANLANDANSFQVTLWYTKL
jgi:hypothetical protein